MPVPNSFTGRSHIRAYAVLDAASTFMESGQVLLDTTVGCFIVSLPLETMVVAAMR
jgi:hypothetical protein